MGDIVTSTALRVVETFGGRKYTLRPPTFGETGELASRITGTLRPGPAMVAETVRQALEALLGEAAAPFVAAVDAHEEADDACNAVLLTRPRDADPPEEWKAWRLELRAVQTQLLAAERRRLVAESKVAAAPAVVAVRSATLTAQLEDRVETVRMCLCGWDGEGLPEWAPGPDGRMPADVVRGLPAGDLAGLAERCNALARPDRAAEGN